MRASSINGLLAAAHYIEIADRIDTEITSLTDIISCILLRNTRK